MNEDLKEALEDAWHRFGCFVTFGFFIILAGVVYWWQTAPHVGADVRSFAFLDAGGEKHRLAEYAGKVVVVDIWATWCPPCQASLPEIAALQAAEDEHYAVVPLSIDKGRFLDVQPFLKAQGTSLGPFKAYVPDLGLFGLGPVHGIPTTIIVGPSGRIVSCWSGYIPGQMQQALKEAIAKRP